MSDPVPVSASAAHAEPTALTPLQRTFVALERTRARLAEVQAAAREPIAIIGMACRVPGADSPAAFWTLMQKGTDAITRVPPERWDHADYVGVDAAEPGRIATHSGGFLPSVDRFDPGFFGISAREANAMDPQQRLLLEVGWEALEHSGIAADTLHGTAVGVYVGATSSDYAYLQIAADDRALLDGHYASGIAQSVLSGRLSYLLGLHGPSLTVDTACSSSLVAVHLACQALRNGDCRMALAGGVNLILSPALFIALSRAHMLAPDGRCKTFDAAADGFARGEGCGVVVLKRESDALADGDRILALIRGSAVNQDGPSSSLSAPNGPAQEAVIRQALQRAALEPSQVGYIEAHGTGTQLGDPLEVGALGAVFAGAPRAAPLLLGSVKTNIGHLEGAAGIAGLIKLVLALRHRTIPPHLHLRTPSPHIPWGRLPFEVPVAATAWPAIDGRCIGGVSAFGFSGTNAHVVVEAAATDTLPAAAAAAADAPQQGSEQPRVIALSARSVTALGALARAVSAAAGDARLGDVCRTLNAGRAPFEWRAAIAADSTAALRGGLAALAQGVAHNGVRSGRVPRRDPPRVAFLFTGQGAQHAGMARGLYDASPVFRAALDECAELAARELPRPLLEVVFGDGAALDRTEYTQPALFAVEYALTRLWEACGVRPAVLLGHSVGEYVAACVAGVFNVADGLRLICRRARLMQSLPAGGAMAAVACAPESLATVLGPELGIAAFNGPAQTVIAGSEAAVKAACETLALRRINAVPLPVSHAFHSHLVEPVLEAFEAAAREVRFAAPRVRLISNLTGAVADADTLSQPQYWRRHLREPVRFADGVRALAAAAPDVVIEIGPHPVLLAFVKAGGALDATALVPSLRRGQADWAQFQESLGTLFLQGARVDWAPLAAGGRVIDLPTYPFERARHWFHAAPRTSTAMPGAAGRAPAPHPLLGARVPLALPGRVYQSTLGADLPAFVRDHVALGRVVLPATAYLEMLFAAAADSIGGGALPDAAAAPWVIEDVTISDAMTLPENGVRRVQTVVEADADGASALGVAISSRLETPQANDAGGLDGWSRHVGARLRRAERIAGDPTPNLAQIRLLCGEPLPSAGFYDDLATRGMAFGPAFRGVVALWRAAPAHGRQILGEVVLPAEHAADAAKYRLHPALLDACLQVMAGALEGEPDALFLPIGIGAVRLCGRAPSHCFSHVAIEGADASRRATVRVFGADGTPVVQLDDVQLRRVARDALVRHDDRWLAPWLYRTAWRRTDVASAVALPIPPAGERQWLIVGDGAASHGTANIAAAFTEKLTVLAVRRVASLEGDAPVLPSGTTDVIDLRALAAANAAEAAAGVCAAAQALLTRSQVQRARLWIVTAGAQAVTGAETALSPAQAAAWGVARTLRLEHPELRTVCVDLDPDAPLASLPAVLALLDRGGIAQETAAESEIAVRGGECWVSRLVRQRLESADAAPRDPCRWVPRSDGTFEHFVREPLTRRRPAAGEVEIAVHATGLNFRDVLNVLGMYPGTRPALGGECAGVVTAVGEGVTSLAIGQRVLALAADSLASHVIARAAMVRELPPGIGMEEAASFPIAFITAEYCLLEVARLQAGESVLIHAGAGGVGMAAIRVAQRIGAQVVATAGSAAKRDLLRTIGVAQVFDSRNPGFAAELLAARGGRGVDVVLNSLSGPMLDASLRVVARGGRFVEIGKRGIMAPAEVAALGRDLAYHIVDWSDPAQADPSLIETILTRLVDSLRAGRITPLPRHVFSVDEAPRAFRLMAAGRHVGRIVLRQPGTTRIRQDGGGLRRDGTYLVTGGLSGIGLVVAGELGKSGAGRVVLVGRRGATAEAAPVIAQLRAAGTTVLTEAVDVSDDAALAALLLRLRSAGPPLRGVVHAAAVLENAVILKQDAAQCARVLAPKLGGAEALDRLTRPDPLDFLVLFSSVAGVLGAPGQANYAAANLALDLVAGRRRRDGLPALAVSWGAWSGSGVAADARTASWVNDQGLGAMTPAQGLHALERLLETDIAAVAVAPLDWHRHLERVHAGRIPAFLTEVYASTDPQTGARAGAAVAFAGRREAVPSLRARLATTPAAAKRALLEAFVRERVGRALGTDPAGTIDALQPLGDLGLDSLLAIELRNTLSSALGRPLPATLLFDHPSIAQLTEYLLTDELGAGDVSAPSGDGQTQQPHERPPTAGPHEPIAIIGMGCRFPGAQTPEEFWRLLVEGRTAIREVPADRWENELLFDADRDAPGRIAIRAAGFLDDIAGFDAAFFGIAPREAASMDPQQRLLLEVAWEALENAGVPPDRLANTATGVFVGQCNADYLQRLLWRGDAAIDGYLASGTSPSVTSGRLAYCLGLRGPALTVDTSCSASLVALHLACRSLRLGETRVALAAGVNLMCAPEPSIAMSKAHMLAPDGRSKAFDAAADGLGRGEGVAVLVLKRLADALADGDPVLAVVRGSAINQDGRSAGLTVPNGPAQEAVIAAALADAGVAAHAIGYVEAHGTGTSLGDPIEVRALANALGAGRSAAQKLLIGSVKSNIGHLEGAAGLAGVIKTVLSLQHDRIVPQPLFRTPNPHIPWFEIPVAVAAGGGAWPVGAKRLAGVSSFGFSGTNAHVVLEAAPAAAASPPGETVSMDAPLSCLPLSARSNASLQALARSYAGLLENGAALQDVARAAAQRRSHLSMRLAVVAPSGAIAAAALRAYASGQHHSALVTSSAVPPGENSVPSSSWAMAQRYVAGATPDWYPPEGAGAAIRLPNYPFDHQRYWVDMVRPSSKAPVGADFYYEMQWQALAAVSSAAPALIDPGRFMPGVEQVFGQLATRHELAIYDRLVPVLDRLSALHVAVALRALGFDDTPGRVFDAVQEAGRLRIVRRHLRLFDRMLEFLAADEVLDRTGTQFRVRTQLPVQDPQELHERVADGFKEAAGPLRILRRCASELGNVLTGATDPVGLLFPGGSFAEASLLYVDSPLARVYNGALTAAALAAIQSLPPGSRLRVLEIGGGTGGTTSTFLPALPADRVDYTFTDVSPLFLERAAGRFGNVRTGRLDIERDPVAQGFAAGGYDLVVAANVLHATADLRQTVQHVRALLAPGGLLLCLEAVAAERWGDLTFGMTEGWSRFADRALRPDHAIVDVATWRTVLSGEGFDQVVCLGGEPGTMRARAQQALLVARAPLPRRRWILVGSRAALCTGLAERLRCRGDDVSVCDVAAHDDTPLAGDLVYLEASALDPQSGASACGELACAAPIRWLARFSRANRAAQPPRRAWLVTSGAQAVRGGVSAAGRFQAPLWGVGRVFALEQPLLWGGLVDLPPREPLDAQLDALVSVLDGFAVEDQIAFREGRAFAARLQRSPPPAPRSLTLHADATYLIVGGFGGVGLRVALWLAERGARHIALLGRTPDLSSEAVSAIKATGARVIPLAGDVADPRGLRALLDGLAREAPPLRGIVHAATAVSVAPIEELSETQIAQMLRPKIAGLLALEEAAPEVDFTVLFSSTTALIGVRGLAHYAAANAFLDATGQCEGGRSLAVNWGTLEVLRAATSGERAALREGGLNPLDCAIAFQAMERMIMNGVRNMAVADIDWSRLKPLYERTRARPLLAALTAAPDATAAGGTDAADGRVRTRAQHAATAAEAAAPLAAQLEILPVEERAEALESWVRAAVAQVLGLPDADAVPSGAGLFELGMDSLMAVALQRNLELGVGRPLPTTLTFNYPNPGALAGFLADLLELPRRVATAATAVQRPLDSMSDEEVERRLRARLEDVG